MTEHPEKRNYTVDERITRLERELGIETEGQRLREAMIAIDSDLVELAVIKKMDFRLLFGKKFWCSWLSGKSFLSQNKDLVLTEELISNLAEALQVDAHGLSDKIFRSQQIRTSDYSCDKGGIPLDKDQRAMIQRERFMQVRKAKSFSTLYHIYYPAVENEIDTLQLIKSLLKELCNWFNEQIVILKEKLQKEDSYKEKRKLVADFAAIFERRLILIHPLEDKNGRLVRLLMNWVIENLGFESASINNHDSDLLQCENTWPLCVLDGIKQTEKISKALIIDSERQPIDALGMRNYQIWDQVYYSRIHRFPDFSSSSFFSRQAWFKYYRELRTAYHSWSGHRAVYVKPLKHDYIYTQVKTSDNHSIWVTDPERIKGQSTIYSLPACSFVNPEMIQAVRQGVSSGEFRRSRDMTEHQVYRGAMLPPGVDLSDENILRIFSDYVGITSSYWVLEQSQVAAMSLSSVSRETVAQTMERYNDLLFFDIWQPSSMEVMKLIVKGEYGKLGCHISLQKIMDKLYDSLLRYRFSDRTMHEDTSKHINWNQGHGSVFVSCSGDCRSAYAYSQGKLGDRYVRRREVSIVRNPEKKTGVLIQSQLPKGYKVTGNTDQEILLPGGIPPQTINRVDFFASGHPVQYVLSRKQRKELATYQLGARGFPRPMEDPILTAERVFEHDGEYILISDKNGVKCYRFDLKKKEYLLQQF